MTGADWDGFVAQVPKHRIAKGTQLYRIHRVEHEPWFFDDDENGRFNPRSESNLGACYFGEDDLCTWIECVPQKRFFLGDIEDRQLATLTTPREYVVLDFTVADALQDGLSVSEVLGIDYTPTHRIAAAAARAGLDGVRWRSRKDFSARCIAVALFGPAGPVVKATDEHPRMDCTDVPADLIERACKTFGYERVVRA